MPRWWQLRAAIFYFSDSLPYRHWTPLSDHTYRSIDLASGSLGASHSVDGGSVFAVTGAHALKASEPLQTQQELRALLPSAARKKASGVFTCFLWTTFNYHMSREDINHPSAEIARNVSGGWTCTVPTEFRMGGKNPTTLQYLE